MNPCHCHLAVPPFIVEASGVCLTRKLVEIVSHAAELADVSGMFLRKPFFFHTFREKPPPFSFFVWPPPPSVEGGEGRGRWLSSLLFFFFFFFFFSVNSLYFLTCLKSATKPFNVLLACTRPLITELSDKLRQKHPLLPTTSPYPTMRLETIRSIIPISCRRYPKSV